MLHYANKNILLVKANQLVYCLILIYYKET